MLSAEKEDLIKRCKTAQLHGFQIALAEDIAKELGYTGEPPPPKVVKFSPAHLIHLATNSVSSPQPKVVQASAKVAKVKPAKAPEPPPAPKAPPPEAPKAAAPETPKEAPPPAPEARKEEEIPTVPVDVVAVHEAVAAMRGEGGTNES